MNPDSPAAPPRLPGTSVSLASLGCHAPPAETDAAVRAAASAATDFHWLSPGDSVFIKVAHNSGKPYPATSKPEAVTAMIRLLRDHGAGRIVVGDMSGVEYLRFSRDSLTGSTRELMRASGLAAAVEAGGAELHCFEEAGWDAFHAEAPVCDSHWQGPIMMPDILREMDHLVLMPRCARHVVAGSSLGLKAAVGYWRHDTRLEYHHAAATLHEKTAEANTVPSLRDKQRLVLTAADRVLATFGPDHGTILETDSGLVIASESVVAHEMAALAWLLVCRDTLPEGERNGFADTSQFMASCGNRVVNIYLQGAVAAVTAEEIVKNPIHQIGDDRILRRATEVLGGVPSLDLRAVDPRVTPERIASLLAKAAVPTVPTPAAP